MKLSIIIPCYNGERFLAQTIESILAQTEKDWELILVDDGSTDRTVRVAQSYTPEDQRMHIVCQPNGGVASARNRGLQEADSGSGYLIFLDQDDVWEPEALETLLAALAASPQAVAAHARLRRIDEEGRDAPDPYPVYRRVGWFAGKAVEWPVDKPTTFEVLALGNVIYTPGQILIRREVLEAAGAFDKAVEPADDWDLWLRLSSRGEICFVDKVILGWRQHSNNETYRRKRMEQAEFKVYDKLVGSATLSREQQYVARFGYVYWQQQVCQLYWGWFKETLVGGRWLHGLRLFRHVFLKFIDYCQVRVKMTVEDKRVSFSASETKGVSS